MTEPATELDAADQLGKELMRFVRLINHFRTHVAPPRRGIENSAYPLLGCLVFEGPRRMTALADKVHSDPSTVSRQISALVTGGLVERQADPEDGRACLLAATERGYALFDELRKQRTEHLAMLLADWTDEEKHTFVTLFGRLNSGLEHESRLATMAGSTNEGEVR